MLSLSCQNPEDASNLLKYFALANCDMISSQVGNLKCSLVMAQFKSVRSKQILSFSYQQ